MARARFIQPGALRRHVAPALVAVFAAAVAWVAIGPMVRGGEDEAPVPAVPVDPEPVVAPEVPAPAPTETPRADRHPPEPVYPSVLVANRDIPLGMLLRAQLVEWRPWRQPLDIDMAVVEGVVPLRAVIGAVARRRFREGDMIAWDGVLMPGHPGFISAVLAPGMLAVTVEVDRATTAANIIYPGDRVDVILVAAAGPESLGPASRTIVRSCRVLAVGSTVLSVGRYGKVGLTPTGDVMPVAPPDGANYTLEVPPVDAERLAVASSAGVLTLAMRPVHAPVASEAIGGVPVRIDEVMPVPERPAAPINVRIIRGTDNAGGAQENA
ncbi:MAG: Flp pilus assembly protein CpaB [Gammaproteobacteria bacterium]|nr:Flp pilus assembly protein CpaB [Gammaproteobacteria bacterium]MYJ76523.1 Flp pilus assembly protein CpaB [Gammaproteobacteria bacterium]